MRRNFKTSGMVLAALAIMALTASAAQGSMFKSTSYPSLLTVETEEQHVFKLATKEIACKVPISTLTASAAAETITLIPTYEECDVKGSSLTASVRGFAAGKCTWLLRATGELVNLECAAGNQVEVEIEFCNFTLPTQKNLGTAIYTNKGANPKEEITIDESVKELKYTVDNIFACEFYLNGTGYAVGKTYQDGKYTGTNTVKAYKDEGGKEGEQIGVFWEK